MKLSTRRGVGAAAAALVGLATLTATAPAASAATGFKFDQRISGANRYETAVAASKLLNPTPGAGSTDVVVVNGSATVDGLTASYLAGLFSAPILYTDTDSVPAVTQAEIDRLGATDVYVVGGENRVSAGVVKGWEDDDLTVTRLAGADRYETAALVATVGYEDDDDDTTAAPAPPEQVFVADGTSTADALAAGPIAWAKNYPILLTDKNAVPQATTEALNTLGSSNRVVLGNGITATAYTALKGTQRLAGADRQETAAKIADDAIATENFSSQSVGLVGGRDANAVDALVAAPLAGSQGVPVLFTGFDDSLSTSTTNYLASKKENYTTSGKGWVFGGLPSVSQKVADAATAAVQ